ncbi:MAG TPA: alkaline phosphatase family protein [Candidatus Dormibacteraeota bacterium]|nr:alkaline phosphatase family protein [Candidatus Dormibacteraeota bacterium]
MNLIRLRIPAVLATLGLAGVVVAAQPAGASEAAAKHVLLISVDGLHQTDLAWYVSHHPDSALADLVHDGVNFTNAQTPFPSDSFPGMVGQVTGGNPKTTGVYYDDSWNHVLLPAGTTSCAGVAPGVEVTYFEQLDKNPLSIDAGQGLAGLPDSILSMTGNPTTLIDPTQLPVDPKTCKPVYPNQYLKVNTIFEVVRAAGLRTAWSDKHPAYQILGGKTNAIQDLFTPEINSNASNTDGQDWTKDNASTQIYDSFKVQAVINEINGFDHSGKNRVGTPNVFGMNFQTISTAEKLPNGGYQADGKTPSALLEGALGYINDKIAAMEAALKHRGLADNTTVILSAKHGQSPNTPSALTRIKDSTVIKAENAAWKAAGHKGDLVAFAVNDDGWLQWDNDTSQAAADFAKAFLLAYNGKGDGSDGKAIATDIQGSAKPYTSTGLSAVHAGADAANFTGVPFGDPRVPDVIGIAQVGTVYTGGTGKVAEHGGDNPQDRDVALVVSGGDVEGGKTVTSSVETTQIAPTILELLGLNPQALQAVKAEGTKVLPSIA